MSSQTLQVNGVFKNSELINHQPNKKVYSKPYLFCEKFVPQEFVAGCTIPGNYCYSGLSESNRVYLETTGNQTLNQSTGGDEYVSSGAIFFDDYSAAQITGSGGYYKYTLTSGKYKIMDSGNNITGNFHITDKSIFYKYGKAGPNSVTKNFS